MNTIHCRIAGCDSKFETAEAVTANATFLCSKHPRSIQVEAVGRKYDPVKDEKDSELRFQDSQFDPSIHRSVDGRQVASELLLEKQSGNSDGTDPDVDAFLKAERNA